MYNPYIESQKMVAMATSLRLQDITAVSAICRTTNQTPLHNHCLVAIVLTKPVIAILVHGQVTIIFVVSVCLSVCLFVCAECFSAVFDPISIKLGHMLYVWV